MHEEILLIDNATGAQSFVSIDEAAVIAVVDKQDLEDQLARQGRCNTIDYTLVDTSQAETVAG